MTNERFFRLLSVALLGAIALAFIPETNADGSAEVALLSAIPEIESLSEIEEINKGDYQPYILETGGAGAALDVSAVDPQYLTQ